MHPCGKYRYNSLGIILSKQFGYTNFRTMYRLDRLTSGLVILGKSLKSAHVIDTHIKERTAEKQYVCRVKGEFPSGRIVVDKPLDCASFKVGLYWVDDKNGKEAKTEFERLSYNGSSSVVLCYPKTGRTHQIRIHLQYLGFPILNDPLYNNTEVWGETNGKGGVYEYNKEQLEQNFLKTHTYESFIVKQENEEQSADNNNEVTNADGNTVENKVNQDSPLKNEICQDNLEQNDENNKRKCEESTSENVDENESKKLKTESQTDDSIKESVSDECFLESKLTPFDENRLIIDSDCFECKQKFRDPKRSELTMYLHALSYKFGDMKFSTEMPKWAKEDFIE